MNDTLRTWLDEALPEVDVSVVERNMANREPRPDAWTVPEGVSIDPEDYLSGPVLDAKVPVSLRPPSTDGASAAFAQAVEAYVLAMCKARWPKLRPHQELELVTRLAFIQDEFHRHDGDVEVMSVPGDVDTALRDPLLLNMWLACLHQGHIADVLECRSGVALVILR